MFTSILIDGVRSISVIFGGQQAYPLKQVHIVSVIVSDVSGIHVLLEFCCLVERVDWFMPNNTKKPASCPQPLQGRLSVAAGSLSICHQAEPHQVHQLRLLNLHRATASKDSNKQARGSINEIATEVKADGMCAPCMFIQVSKLMKRVSPSPLMVSGKSEQGMCEAWAGGQSWRFGMENLEDRATERRCIVA